MVAAVCRRPGRGGNGRPGRRGCRTSDVGGIPVRRPRRGDPDRQRNLWQRTLKPERVSLEELWAGLEDYVLDHARTYAQRLTVLTAPVFGDDDPLYRGTRVPRRFWKVVAWNDGDEVAPALAATGYVLDQSEQLDALDLSDQAQATAPPLGAYLTYQVPVVDIATLTGLDLDPLVAADRMPAPPSARVEDLTRGSAALETRWVRLTRASDVRL